MKQKAGIMLTKEQVIELYESNFWEDMSYEEIAKFQMNEKLLCMPFSTFHEAVEKTLGRPVFTHEFGLNFEGLKKEINGEIEAPSFEDIINLIPAKKRIIVMVEDNNEKV